jgi:hypothetical protein
MSGPPAVVPSRADPQWLSESEASERLAGEVSNEVRVSQQRGWLRLPREVASEPMFLLLFAC